MVYDPDLRKSAGIFLAEVVASLLVLISQQFVSPVMPFVFLIEGWFLIEIGKRGTDVKQRLGFLPWSIRLRFILFGLGCVCFGIVLSYKLWGPIGALIVFGGAVLTLGSKLMCFRELRKFTSQCESRVSTPVDAGPNLPDISRKPEDLRMFEVTSVKYVLLSKQVELTALDDMKGSELVFGGGIGRYGPRIPEPHLCPYDFPRGSAVTLGFASWKAFSVGDRLDLPKVLKYDSMQQLLLRNAGY